MWWELDRVIPRMVHVYRPACLVAPDGVAPRFLALDQGVVAGLANGGNVAEIEEQCLIALMRPLVVRNGRARMMSVALYD